MLHFSSKLIKWYVSLQGQKYIYIIFLPLHCIRNITILVNCLFGQTHLPIYLMPKKKTCPIFLWIDLPWTHLKKNTMKLKVALIRTSCKCKVQHPQKGIRIIYLILHTFPCIYCYFFIHFISLLIFTFNTLSRSLFTSLSHQQNVASNSTSSDGTQPVKRYKIFFTS
jgi:hypothetical protein